MNDIRKNIDDADKTAKEKAENILKNVSDNYRDKVIAAIANAKDMEAKARKAGNIAEADRYKLAAEIYQSLLDSLGLRH
jgi:hypothetical protein